MLESEDILGKVVRVVLSDRRVIEGVLLCMDRHLNFAIGDAMVRYDDYDLKYMYEL